MRTGEWPGWKQHGLSQLCYTVGSVLVEFWSQVDLDSNPQNHAMTLGNPLTNTNPCFLIHKTETLLYPSGSSQPTETVPVTEQ